MSLFGTGRRETLIAACLLAVCALAVHLPGVLFGQHRQVVSSAGLDGSNAHGGSRAADWTFESATNEVLLYPALEQAARAAQRDHGMPLWNPTARFGEPFSFSGAPTGYPPYWLLMLDLGPWSYDLLLALHSMFAVLAMFRFLRVMPLSRYVAFVGGAAYGIGWFFTANLDRLPEAAAAALLPLALECTWRCLSQRRSQRIFVPVLGLTIAMMFASGSTTTAWLGVALCVASLLAGLGAVEREHRSLALRMAGMGAVCAVLLSAPLWLEWLQHLGTLHRPSDEAGRAPRLQFAGLGGLLAPGLSGDLRGHGGGSLRDVSPGADPLELVLYPGAFVIFASLLGLFRPKRTLQGLFWVGVAGAGLLLSVESPLHSWIGWAPARPGAALVLFHFALVVMAAISLETFFDAPIARRVGTRISSILTFAGLATIVTCGLLQPSWGDAIVGALVDGSASSAEIASTREHLFTTLMPPAIALALIGFSFLVWRRFGILRFKPVLAAIALFDLALPAMLAVPRGEGIGIEESVADVLAQLPMDAHSRRAIAVGRGGARPIPGWIAAGGQPMVNTPGRSIFGRTGEYLAAIDPSCVQTDRHRSRVAPLVFPGLLDDRLVAMAGIHVATATGPLNSESFHPAAAAPIDLETSDRPYVLHDIRTTGASRARLVFRVDDVHDARSAAFALRERSAGSADSVLLEGRPRELESKPPLEPIEIEWLEDRPRRIHLRTEMGTARGYLVLADAHGPGWKATVDGEPAEILTGDLAFRAIPLREGTHEIVFSYRPWSYFVGLPLLAAGLLLGLAYWFWQTRRLRRPLV